LKQNSFFENQNKIARTFLFYDFVCADFDRKLFKNEVHSEKL